MAYQDRKKLIEKIEKLRGSKVLTYVITHRFDKIMIEPSDLRYFYEILNKVEKGKKIDLFIYSMGGVSTVAWALNNLIRTFSPTFSVLIPYNAFSCATSIAIGSDEIVMGQNAYLGPVDPSVINDFNPIINNQLVPISVEDIAGFHSLIKDKFDINDGKLGELLEILAKDVRPLALGNAYRHYLKARDDTKKILETHFKKAEDADIIKKISETLIEKLYYHGHHIVRTEAKGLGLNIVEAENLVSEDGKENLNDLMWSLYLDYEKELELKLPYELKLPESGDTNEIPIKFIESSNLSQEKIIQQKFNNLNYPPGTRLIINNNMLLAVYTLDGQQMMDAPFAEGILKCMNDGIYEITEKQIWKEVA